MIVRTRLLVALGMAGGHSDRFSPSCDVDVATDAAAVRRLDYATQHPDAQPDSYVCDASDDPYSHVDDCFC